MEPKAINVQLLGGFSVTYGPYALQSLPPQSVSLLAYLILNRGRPQTRDLLAGRFWSDLPDDRARRRLSNTLWQIKNACIAADIPELLTTTASSVHVTSQHALSIDAENFIAKLDEVSAGNRSPYSKGRLADRLAAVAATYAGDLLDGHYDDWIETERFVIRERYLETLRQLVKMYKGKSDYQTAVRFARDLVAQDQLQEEAHKEVMRLYAMLGQVSAAERQFNLCRDVLKHELGVDIAPGTVELMEQIRIEVPAQLAPTERTATDFGVMVGRTDERSVMLDQADALVKGTGGVVLIEADAGLGKSRLVHEFVKSAEWRGLRVLSAGHTQLSSLRAFDGLREALEPTTIGLRGEHLAEVLEPVWLQHVANVFPELKRHLPEAVPTYNLRPEEEPTRMSEALARVLLAQGGLAPTVVVLEDVHWADDDTMDVLAQVGERLADSGVLLCASFRRDEALQSEAVWASLARLERLERTTRVSLAALDADEIRKMIMANTVAAQLPDEVIDYVVEASQGSPLFVVEALKDPQALRSLGQDLLDGEDPLAGHLPLDVAQALQSRISDLPTPARLVLEALSALAEPATAHTVARIAGLDRREALVGLTTAVDKGLLVELEEGYCRFGQEQTRHNIYDGIAEIDRRAIHRRIVDHLFTSDPVEPEQVAYHARLAHRWNDAYDWHLRAADRALEIHAYRTAAEHYGQADGAASEAGVARSARVADLLRYEAALDMLGRRSEQTNLLKELADMDLDFEVEVGLAVRRTHLLGQTDQHAEALRLATSYLGPAKEAGIDTYPLLSVIGMVLVWSGDIESAIDSTSAAFEAAPSDSARIESEIWQAKALNSAARFDEAEVKAQNALTAATTVGDQRNQIEALGALAGAVRSQVRLPEAEELLLLASDLGRRIGYRYGEGVNLVNLASVCGAQGRGGQALDLFGRAAEIFASLDNRRGETFVRVNSAELNANLLGNFEGAARDYQFALEYFRSVGDKPREWQALAGLAAVECKIGKRRLGHRRLGRILSAGVEEVPPAEVRVRRVLALDEMEAGSLDVAAAHLERIGVVLAEHRDPWSEPNVLAQRAVVELRMGATDEAVAFAEKAVAINELGTDQPHATALWCCEVFSVAGLVVEADEQASRAFTGLSESLSGLDTETANHAWRSVQVHVQIAEAYERRFPRYAQASLPRVDAPAGRTLKADEYRTVTWTISEPEDWQEPSASDRRRRRIGRLGLEAQEQGATARVADLASTLGVSERTVKRDLAALRQHSGADVT